MLFGRHSRLAPAAAAALARVLEAPTFELIPLRNALDEAAALPPGARVSITASPSKGSEATLELAERLVDLGLRPIPHLAARMVRDRAHLADLMARAADARVGRVFVVGGDEKVPGEFPDALSLIRAMAETAEPLPEIGIGCYPQSHAFIPDDALLEALRAKAPYASYMTTQLCFDPSAIGTWLAARRAEGIGLPVHIGLPGVAEPHRLLAISARIGVADTQRFVMKNTRFVARMIRSGGFYKPTGLLEALAPTVADPEMCVTDVHIYTFNAVRATEEWRRDELEKLRLAAAHVTV